MNDRGNEEIFYSYNKNINFPKISKTKSLNKLNNSSSTGFLERNYNSFVIKKLNRKRSLDNLLTPEELNSLLYKMKNNYNELLNINKNEDINIKKLKEEKERLEFKNKYLTECKNIILPNEQICFKELENLNYSNEEIENIFLKMIQQKQALDFKLKNENEYSKTIEYMFEDEKDKILKIHEESINIGNKLALLKKHKKILDEHLNNQVKKKKNYSNLIQKIEKDIHLICSIINSNEKKVKELDEKIIKRENENNEIKDNLILTKEKNIIELNEHKEKTINLINKLNDQENEKIEKEKNYIKTVLCLNLIQKFFIYNDEFNYNELIESKDYKDLTGDIFIINDKDNIIFNSKIYEFPFKKDKLIKNKSEENLSETTNTFNLKKRLNSDLGKKRIKSADLSYLTYTKMDLNDLIEKFNEIKFTQEEIYEYNSKMISKIKFYKEELMNYNYKIITYKNKKEKYTKKVNEIIIKDYKNFIDLIYNNSKFENFINKNKDLIKNSEEKEIITRKNKINSIFTSEEPKKGEGFESQNPIQISSFQLYNKCYKLIRENKNFFKEILSVWKFIIETYQDINEDSFENYDIILKYNFKIDNLIQPNFLDYLNQLFSFFQNNENLKEKYDIDLIYKNLISPFYKNKEENIINEEFYNQFQLKKIRKEYEIFYNFSLMNETIKNLKIISDYIKDLKNKKLTIKKNEEINVNEKILSPKSFSTKSLSSKQVKKNIIYNNFMNTQKTRLSKFMKKLSIRNINNNNNYNNSLEEEQSENDTETTQPDIKINKKKSNSIDEKIVKKLYQPFLEKSFYARELNSNLKNIKNLTMFHNKKNYSFIKKQKEINELSQQLFIYNNPLINVNEISSPNYNSIISNFFSNRKNIKSPFNK